MRIVYEDNKNYEGTREGSGEKQRVAAQLVFVQPPYDCKLKKYEAGKQVSREQRASFVVMVGGNFPMM